MAVQKPLFLVWYREITADASLGEWFRVVGHGLTLDLTVAGYITVVPLLVVLASLWVPLAERTWRRVLIGYFSLISLLTALIVTVDLGLYAHWGFRLDATILMYLSEPKQAMASVDWGTGLRQTGLLIAYAALMIFTYSRVVRLWESPRLPWLHAGLWTPLVLLLAGVNFVAIRGGLGTSVANISKVYFSSRQFLNHAATNPLFSFLSTLGKQEDYASQYLFFDEAERAERFEALRGNTPAAKETEKILRTDRPNVVVIVLESFGRTVMDAQTEGQAVMPYMQRLKTEGVWFENFFANSFRTDRGQVSILSGFPAQTGMSIMKVPNKSSTLPSLARTLGKAGYATSFTYGGDLNFTNQASYMYATGWQELTWQKDLHFATPAADWGYDDALMCDYFAEQVIAQTASGKPFLAGFLTLSSHPPFDVPYKKFADEMFNAMAFTDACVGRLIEQLKASPAWDNLVVVLVADHGFPYPSTLDYNNPLRQHIPMLWLGGALTQPRVVDDYASQIDLCATLLAQMGLPHDDFEYSKNLFATAPIRKFAYYTFDEGFGVVDASGAVVWDAVGDRVVTGDNPDLLNIGRTMLQTTYADIARR